MGLEYLALLLRKRFTYDSPAPSLLAFLQIAALQVGPEYNAHFATLYKFFVAQARTCAPVGAISPTSGWLGCCTAVGRRPVVLAAVLTCTDAVHAFLHLLLAPPFFPSAAAFLT